MANISLRAVKNLVSSLNQSAREISPVFEFRTLPSVMAFTLCGYLGFQSTPAQVDVHKRLK